jgi:hypothetical protein
MKRLAQFGGQRAGQEGQDGEQAPDAAFARYSNHGVLQK